jgi:serine phosphatase RsbU (regulator of sigma subunit)
MHLKKIHHKVLLLVMLVLAFALGVALVVVRMTVEEQAKKRIYKDLDARFELISILIKSEESSLKKQVVLLSEEPTIKMSLQTGDRDTIRDTSTQLQEMIQSHLFVVTDSEGKNLSQLPARTVPVATEGLDGISDSLMGSTASDLWFDQSTLYLSASQAISFHEVIEGTVSCSLRLDQQFARTLGERTGTIVTFLFHGQKVTQPDRGSRTGPFLGRTYQVFVGNSSFEIWLLVDYSEVLQGLDRVTMQLLSLYLFVLLIAYGVSQVFSRSLTRPIQSLKGAVLSVSEGNWEQPLEATSHDELGVLEKSFEEMRQSLVTQRDELIETEALRKDLELSAGIQRSMLPSQMPEIKGISLCARIVPSNHIGGDYFGFPQWRENNLGIAIADVAGHGVGSGLLMAMARTTLLSQAEITKDASSLLCAINRILHPDLEKAESFISMFLCSYDLETRVLEYANAGHNRPLLLRSDGSIEELDTDGMVIGILEDSEYEAKTCLIQPGDFLVLYTDGMIEPHDSHGIQYGMARFTQLLKESSSSTVQETLDHLYENLEEFCGKEEASKDDRTCVMLRFLE